MATHLSNHTLQALSLYEDIRQIQRPKDLRSLLRLNRECGKSQAARIKIIQCHFSCGHNSVQAFAVMETKVLPQALSWAAKAETNDTLYRIIRAVPFLFGGATQGQLC